MISDEQLLRVILSFAILLSVALAWWVAAVNEFERSPREFSEKQRKLILEMLKEYSSLKPKIRVVYANTAEAERFARQWEAVLTESGWNVLKEDQIPTPQNMALSAFEGFKIAFQSSEPRIIGAPVRLRKAIYCIGIEIDKINSNTEGNKEGVIELLVGVRGKNDKMKIRSERGLNVTR